MTVQKYAVNVRKAEGKRGHPNSRYILIIIGYNMTMQTMFAYIYFNVLECNNS